MRDDRALMPQGIAASSRRALGRSIERRGDREDAAECGDQQRGRGAHRRRHRRREWKRALLGLAGQRHAHGEEAERGQREHGMREASTEHFGASASGATSGDHRDAAAGFA